MKNDLNSKFYPYNSNPIHNSKGIKKYLEILKSILKF